MPTIQEIAVRNANPARARGVSVYSPQQQLRAPGGRANRGTAQRIMQGGGRGQSPFGPAPTGGASQVQLPSYRPPDQAGQGRTGRTPLDDILEGMSANDPQPQEEEGGWKGALGTVVNSMPFKAIMAPLNILDIPRRAVVSTVNEVADVFNGGDASWDDWLDQVKDPNFGFGSVVGQTGNIWADRFIGFAGDVLLDPLTYVAGAGVFSGTGRATRTRLASLAASEGLGEDVIRSIGRYGLSGVDNATRAKLRQAADLVGRQTGEQILDRGYYLKVPFRDTFKQIPGTAALDSMISPVFAHGRARLAEGRTGTWLRNRLRTPEVMREATEKLITGRGTMSFDDAAGIYIYSNARRQIGNTATNRFMAEATKVSGEFRPQQLNGMIDVAETQGGTALNALFARGAKFMQDAGIDFWPRKNYVPHILTQPALEWFRSASKAAVAFREALIPGLDINKVSPRLMERHLLAGTTAEIGLEGAKRTFNAGAGTIKAINEEFARVFPEMKFKLFDDEISSIFAVYGRHLGDDIGEAGALKTLANSKSRLVRLRSDDDMVKTLVDEASLDLLNKQTADMLRADHRSLTDRITRLRQEQVSDTLGLQGVLGVHMRETVDDLENLEQQLKDELDQLIVSESELSHRMGRTSAMTGEAPASNIGQLEVKLQDAYTRLEARAMAADQRLADLQDQAARELTAWTSMQTMFGTDIGMTTIPTRFAALRNWNVTTAEAASLAMDREAVSTMRIELAQLIRKANLAEEAADNPVAVGLRAGLPLQPEEYVGAGVRLNADGTIIEYTGPTAGPRGTRKAAEETLYQGKLLDYEVAMSQYKDDLKDYRRSLREWKAREAANPEAKNPKPRKPVEPTKPTRYKEPIGSERVRKGKEGRTFHAERERQPGRLTVATNRVRWDADQKIHDIISTANRNRERAILDMETLSLGPQRAKRAALERELLQPDAEAELLGRYDRARTAMQNDPDVRAYNQAQAELPRVETALNQARDNLKKTPRVAAGDRREQAINDAQARIDMAITGGAGGQKVWKIDDGKIVLNDRSAPALDLYDRYARLTRGGRRTRTSDALAAEITQKMGPFPNVRDPQSQALAQAQRLATARKNLQKDLDLTVKGPDALPKLKRDPARVALEENITALEAQRDQLRKAVADGKTKTEPLRKEFEQANAKIQRQREVYNELQKEPPGNTANLLMDTQDRIKSKQAQLADEENRVNRLAEMHRDSIDNAEQRVELAVNMDAELRRRERDAWGVSDTAERAAQREVRAHQDGELHAAKEAFKDAQKPVDHARKRRDAVRKELEELKDELASGPDTPPEVGQLIHRANMTEKALIRDARGRIPTVKTEWRIFPEIDAPPRRGVLTFEQRDRLEELYDIVHNTHPVDRAGSGGSYLVRQARETVTRIKDAGGPGGPRDQAALLEAQKILGDHALGRMNTGAHQRYRKALSEINSIERAVKEGAQGTTYAQQEYGEVRRISGMVTQLEELRTPMRMPGKGSKDWKAIAASPRTPGGDRSVLGRAKENHELAVDWIDNFSQDLIDTGAIDSDHVEYIARMRDEVKRLVDVHKMRKTPDVKSQLAQTSSDLGRLVDVMLSYQAALGRGYEPGPQLATAIAAHRYLRERSTLDDSIEVIEGLLKISPEERTRVFNESISNYEAKIAIEQKKMDDPDLDEKARRNARERRDYNRRELGKRLDAGVAIPGTGDLRGVIEDDVDSMVGIIMEHLNEFDQASLDLRGMTNWRDVYVEPIERQHRAEVNVGRLELQGAHLAMAKTRLEKAIARAKASRRKTVSYRPTKSTSFTQTISDAERAIELGNVPQEMIPVVRNEIRIAERRSTASQKAAKAAGRKPNEGERYLKYSVVGRETTPTEMTLAEAEAELARYPGYIESHELAIHRNKIELETMNGESARRITTLETLVKDAETPLNDAGLKALKDRARELDATARARPGNKNMPLDKKRTPEETAEIKEIAARIEQSSSPPDPERLAAMQEEIAERQKFRADYERDMVYDVELMGHVEDNGYRLLRELTHNLRSPSKAEARVLRQLVGAEQGEQARQVLATLDDYINAEGYVNRAITNERMESAIRYIQDLASSRRINDDGLDRVLPPDEAGRVLNLGEMSRAAQASSEISLVLGGSGRQTSKTLDAEGFRENFFQVLIEEARVRRQDAERQIKHFVGWLDMAVNEDIVSTIGIVNKYFGGKLRDFTKKQRAAMRKANQPIPKLSVRREKLIRETIVDAMQKKGYDPAMSLERKLADAKTLRSRLNTTIRGLGITLVDGAPTEFYSTALGRMVPLPDNNVDELLAWWDEAARGQLGTIDSLAGLVNTLRPADDIAALAKTRRTALTREISKATKAGDTETVAALKAELDTISQGRYLPEQGAAPAAAPEPAPKKRRKAKPSEVAANQLADAADPEELTRLRTELAGLEPQALDLDHQVASKSDQVRALESSLAVSEAPRPAEGSTVASVLKELEDYAATARKNKNMPKGAVSYADLELARARSAAYGDSFPLDVEMTPEQEAHLEELTNDMMRKNEKVWAGEPREVRRKAEAIHANLPMAGNETTSAAALNPDAQAGIIDQITTLKAEVNAAQVQLDAITTQKTSLQQRIDDLDKAHTERTTSDPNVETPSMVEDPIGASQAEGLPPEGLSPETAPSHLTDDAIFDADASPEDLLKEYDSVVAQSRALLNQYKSYKDMPPDVRRSAGELANRAEMLAKRREETFAAATKGYDEAAEGRLVGAAQSAAQAANPRTDMDWWTAITTGTPPAGPRTTVMRGVGTNRKGVLRNQIRTSFKQGMPRTGGGAVQVGATPVVRRVREDAQGRITKNIEMVGGRTVAGGRHRGSLRARAEVLGGRHDPRVKVKRRNPKTNRMRGEVVSNRPLTRFERKTRQVEQFNTAERDLRGIAERSRAGADELEQRIFEKEMSMGERAAKFDEATTAFSEEWEATRAQTMAEHQVQLNHTNDEAARAERHAQRVSGQRERINDAYTRALDSENIQLGDVRRQAVEARLDHDSAHRKLTLMRGSMRDPKNSNLRQIWSDVGDLMKLQRASGVPEPPIALGPVGGTPGPAVLNSSQPEIRQIEALLAAALDQQRQIDDLDLHGGVIAKRLKDFDRAPKKQAFHTPEQMLAMSPEDQARFGVRQAGAESQNEVFIHQIADGWQAVAEDMFTGPDALVIANTLQQAMDNIRRTTHEPGFWQVIEKYTAFFSTYATMKPGFHVRNAMSGTFMNMVDGVKIRNMRKAPGIWRDFMNDPEGFWAREGAQAEQHRQALMAVFGSGAGGQFSERGLTEAVTVGSKLYRKTMNNTLTKWNRKAGAYVEGPMRLAMALDSIERGMSLNTALDRITKFHFDYTQLSEMDVIARRMIPFWTFMSRNLPLQIESMWLRPRTYLQYQSLVRNFGEEMNPYTPDYWLSQGAFTVDENAKDAESPWYLAPDLPHLRVAEPLTALAQGDLGRAVLSDINPLFLAPVEALAAGKKFYTGQRITDEPRAPQGAGEAMLAPLLALLGGPEGASGQALIDPRAAHIATSTLPPLEFLQRLTSQEGTRAGRQGETIARSLGAPVYKLTPEVQEATRMSRFYDELDERQRQAELARL